MGLLLLRELATEELAEEGSLRAAAEVLLAVGFLRPEGAAGLLLLVVAEACREGEGIASYGS